MVKLHNSCATAHELAVVSRVCPDQSTLVKALIGLGRVQAFWLEFYRKRLRKVSISRAIYSCSNSGGSEKASYPKLALRGIILEGASYLIPCFAACNRCFPESVRVLLLIVRHIRMNYSKQWHGATYESTVKARISMIPRERVLM